MAGIGIGLGGFMDGFTRGMDARAAMDERKRTKVLQERQDQEYNRAVGQRNEIDAINSGAKTEFDKRVSAGTEKPDNFDQFWSGYALPKLKNTYLSQGNMDMAEKVQAWGESEDAKAGARFAMSALTKAQTGDAAGALTDAMEAGKRKGYISHGFEINGQDQIVDPSGKLQGYRLYMKGPDGKEIQQDLPLDQVPKLIATYLNPEAAWQSQVAGKAEDAKTARELATYEEKKKIDKQYGTGGDKRRGDAIDSLRKRMDGGLSGDEKKFDDLPREEQEKMISSELELQAGQPGLARGSVGPTGVPQASGRKALVDTATGQPVQPKASKPSADTAAPTPSATTPQQSREERISYLIQESDVAISDGQQPERVAEGLLQNGIPREQWPASLREALANKNRVSIGLNR